MNSLSRRGFMKSRAPATALGCAGNIFSAGYSVNADLWASSDTVQLMSDGLNFTPLEYSRLLLKLAEEKRIEADYYSLGGSVKELESKFARVLGKESAVFMPTGTLANQNNIRLHLDGARLFLASAYTGITPSEYAALFDTVYVSLWKYFNAASGAILAGARSVIENMFHTRRMFGGGLPAAWPYAAVAMNYLDGFVERFKAAIKVSEDLILELKAHPSFRIERVPAGTNVFQLRVQVADADAYWKNLEGRGVLVSPPAKGSNVFVLLVNETLNRVSAPELAERFIQSLPGK